MLFRSVGRAAESGQSSLGIDANDDGEDLTARNRFGIVLAGWIFARSRGDARRRRENTGRALRREETERIRQRSVQEGTKSSPPSKLMSARTEDWAVRGEDLDGVDQIDGEQLEPQQN